MAADGLLLLSDGLLSKWGFNDGDLPDEAWDRIDEAGIEYASVDWHAVLRGLVRAYLLPALEQTVEIYDIETIHNPVRARSVDGTPVRDAVMFGNSPAPRLTPDFVVVPWEVVMDRCRCSKVDV